MPLSAHAVVYLGDRRVGVLGYEQGNTWFQYEDLEPGHPVLGQSFEIDPGHRRTASGGVPEWFSNLLPERESGLRELILRELDRPRMHDFALLTYLGQDLPGAVRVIAAEDVEDIPELSEIDKCAHDHPLRFSLAGVQSKFSMRYEHKALVLPASGQGGDWIVKLPDRRFELVPENEFAMLAWAKLAGIDVPETRLVAGRALTGIPKGLIAAEELALAVRRFDRKHGERIHQEDFAQIRESSVDTKYEQATFGGLGRIIKALCPQDVDAYIRRLVAMVVMGNLDAHLKNWTLIYPDGRTARLSPAYDLVAVTAYAGFEHDELAFSLGNTRRSNLVTVESFRRLGATLDIDADHVVEVAKEAVELLAATWISVKRDCPVPDFVVANIDERLRKLPLVRLP